MKFCRRCGLLTVDSFVGCPHCQTDLYIVHVDKIDHNVPMLTDEELSKKIVGWKPVSFQEKNVGINNEQYDSGTNYEPILEGDKNEKKHRN